MVPIVWLEGVDLLRLSNSLSNENESPKIDNSYVVFTLKMRPSFYRLSGWHHDIADCLHPVERQAGLEFQKSAVQAFRNHLDIQCELL